MEPVIKIESLSFSYPESVAPALSDINLSIYPGSFVAVLGANGCGKSTLAKHLNSILVPSAGRVLVDGLDTADDENLLAIRRRVGMVFQNPDNQIVANVVEDDVAFAPENLGVPPQEIRRRVDDALRQVGMYEMRMHAPHLLSGGQKQRVAIAGILAMEPQVLVLDEPTAMLDPHGRREVMDTIEALCRDRGITVILITHHMEEAARADRVIVMNQGRVMMDGTPREIFPQAQTLKKLALAVPDSSELIARLNAAGMSLPADVLTEAECAAAIGEALGSMPSIAVTPPAAEKSATGRTIMELKGLTHTYSQGTPFEKIAVDHIDLSLQHGQTVAILGHTGSGKSTMIQHMNALLKPTEGTVLLDGQDIFASKEAMRRSRFLVGLVFQYPEYQLFEENVFDDIAFGPKNQKLPKEEIDRRVRSAAAFVGLGEDIFPQSPLDLSGGQKRRVAIAGVLAMEPELLVLDEPTAGLDPAGRADLLDKLMAWRTAQDATVLLVTHDMNTAAECDRLLVMDGGHLVMDGTPGEVFSHGEQLQGMGLDIPSATRISSLLRHAGIALPENIYTIDQLTEAVLAIWKGGCA